MDPKEKEFYQSILIVASIVGIILVYLIITIIRYHLKRVRLNKEKIQAEIDTLEKERRRIASDLHDELGALLAAVKLQINSLDTNDPSDHEVIQASSRHIDNIIGKLREISNNLMPNTLVRKGLKKAIEEFIENTRQASGLQLKFVCSQDLKLDLQKSINIYRIIQEIVHNTLKHAGASYLIIQITVEGSSLLLMTADDGKGFNYFTKVKDNPGLGLRNLQSRAEVMGGEMACQSESGKGTMYTFEIPV